MPEGSSFPRVTASEKPSKYGKLQWVIEEEKDDESAGPYYATWSRNLTLELTEMRGRASTSDASAIPLHVHSD